MFRISSHLQRNSLSGIFYFRLGVPERLRYAIGKREIKRSLRTGVRSEAIIAAMQLYLGVQGQFQGIEDKMANRKKRTISG